MHFTHWSVMIDIAFWTTLAKKKIEEFKLSSSQHTLVAKYRLTNKPDKMSILSIDAFSFLEHHDQVISGPVDFKLIGSFLNTNTVEEFNCFSEKEQEDKMVLKQRENIKALVGGAMLPTITELFLLTFGDLKKHTFMYQFYSTAIPVQNYTILNRKTAAEAFSNEIPELNNYLRHFLSKGKQVDQLTVLKNWQISSLKQFIDNPIDGRYLFCIADTTNYPQTTGYHTSTILSIFAYLLEEKLVAAEHLTHVQVLLMKEFLVFNLQKDYSFKTSELYDLDLSKIELAPNEQRLSHKKKVMSIDLKAFMDERILAKQAVDLNIKLMKWRLLPTLNIEKIMNAKCLLFGAGTLGCQVARNLIGWGVKNITFIDNSKVSYSNPVRQSLYDYEDTISGGKQKAQAAAEKLRKIYPQLNANFHNISIPMPGHYVTNENHIKQTFAAIDVLEKAVSEHDVLFLLLDSREARWLPTVLANKYDKACITVGLGFDSFVVVRHGVSPFMFDQLKHRQRICCYFCNDIVTPQNTMKDRTLDQMCTVTKPGLSFISSAYACELFISLLHHPLGHHAPAHENENQLETTDIGNLPHHLRGNISDFSVNKYYGKAFEQCVACSKYILDEYNANRDEFMLKVLNDPSFIHQVVHLKQELEQYANSPGGIIELLDDEIEQMTTKMLQQQANKESTVTTTPQDKPKQ